MTDTDYKTLINDKISLLARAAADGAGLSTDQIVAGLIPGHPENRRYKQQVLKTTCLKSADFDKAMHRKRVIDFLGSYPNNASKLVANVVDLDGIICLYNGSLKSIKAHKTKLNGTEITLCSDHMNDPQMKTIARILARPTIRYSDFVRSVRLVRDKLHLKEFSDTQISDATDEWYEGAKRERCLDLFKNIAGPLASAEEEKRCELAFTDLVESCFDTEGTSTDFVAAVLQKFIWQVKRKMLSLPITDHLMPVLLGPQGSGKSTFVRLLTEPLKEATASVDFKMIVDERVIDVWTNYILFIDEMGYATKTDIDTVKNIITAERLSRRPMRTNHIDLVTQNATFIGASNKELSELIRDPTGARRFIGLRYRRDASWEAINAFLWADLWRSVDADGADPMKKFAEELTEQQALARYRSPVESWVDQFEQFQVYAEHWSNKSVKASDLYAAYRRYEDAYHPSVRTSITEWGSEMTRLIDNQGDARVFEKFRSTRGNHYRYLGSARSSSATSKVVSMSSTTVR